MKRLLSVMMLLLLAGSLCAPAFAAPAEDENGECAKVFIVTGVDITREYVGCSVRVVDPSGEFEDVSTDDAKIKIRGNSTSSGAKKPYNIKFGSKTDVLGMGKNKKWCLLANCYDKTLLRNQMVFDFAYETGLRYTPKYRVAEVYLNGRLQGAYLLTDAVQASSSRVDIDTDGNEFILERDARTDEGTVYFTTSRYGIRFGINEPEEQTPEQYSWLMNFLKEAESALVSGKFENIEKYFDIPSMIDFYIILEYFKNVDIDVGSTRFYIKENKIYGGPCWDFDLSTGNCYSGYYTDYNNVGGSGDSTQGFWARKLWFRPLLNYDEFRTALYARYLELQDRIVNLYADNVNGESYLTRMTAQYEKTIARNYSEAGWSIRRKYSELEHVPVGSYEGEIEYLRKWLEKRNDWLLDQWGLESRLALAENAPYALEGLYIKGLVEKTRVSEFAKAFSNTAISVLGQNGNALGEKAFVYNGAPVSCGGMTYIALLRGDPVPDGEVTAADYAFIKRYFLGTLECDDKLRLDSADANSNGGIDPADYAMVKRHVIGTFALYEAPERENV